jgi:hypothetical protein
LSSAKTQKAAQDFTFEEILTPSGSQFRNGIPAAPFLIPAVLEVLRNSRFSEKVKLVAAEADIYCAIHAQQHDSVVFTGDSDLLIHDLRNGRVAFFDSVQSSTCSSCDGKALLAKTLNPHATAERLRISEMERFGFEVQQDPTASFSDARRRAQAAITGKREEHYAKFVTEYKVMNIMPQTDLLKTALISLDPRVSEFMVQILQQNTGPVQIYLPFLLDDPSRASAWHSSWNIRCFAYSLATLAPEEICELELVEYSRRGTRITPTNVERKDREGCIDFAESFLQMLHSIGVRLNEVDNIIFWRSVSAILVLSWYMAEGQAMPGEHELHRAWNGKRAGNTLTWRMLHLSAQLQAVILTLRQVQQVLNCLNSLGRLESDGPLAQLIQTLSRLPMLEFIIPPESKMPDVQINLRTAQEIAHDLLIQSGSHKLNSKGPVLEGELKPLHTSKKKRNKKKKRERLQNQVTRSQNSQKVINPYSLLNN